MVLVGDVIVSSTTTTATTTTTTIIIIIIIIIIIPMQIDINIIHSHIPQHKHFKYILIKNIICK